LEPWQGLKPAVHPKHLRGAEAPLFHGKAALVAFFSNLLETPFTKAAQEILGLFLNRLDSPGIVTKLEPQFLQY
jgi:hypothetical protein